MMKKDPVTMKDIRPHLGQLNWHLRIMTYNGPSVMDYILNTRDAIANSIMRRQHVQPIEIVKRNRQLRNKQYVAEWTAQHASNIRAIRAAEDRVTLERAQPYTCQGFNLAEGCSIDLMQKYLYLKS
jgi:hypothetical protein